MRTIPEAAKTIPGLTKATPGFETPMKTMDKAKVFLKKAYKPFLRYGAGILLFVVGAMLSREEQTIPACIVFASLGILEIAVLLSEKEHLLSLRILFSASWLFGLSVTSLKLSYLQNLWGAKTFWAFGLFYFAMMLGYDLLAFFNRRGLFNKLRNRKTEEIGGSADFAETDSHVTKRIHQAIYVVLVLSYIGLLLEAVKFGFQFPILVSGKPHAYTEFHITGVHYFVISVVLVPALSMVYWMRSEKKKKVLAELLIVNALGILVPILLLSKFNLVLFFAFPVLIWAQMTEKQSRKKMALMILGSVVATAVLFVLIVLKRSYDPGYLESIFNFKNEKVPVFVQYPYIYVANNFENFNLLVEGVNRFSFGTRMLSPFVSITGLKFIPQIASLMTWQSVPATIKELTTVTILYDAYGDFGLYGCVGFGLLLGVVSAWIEQIPERKKSVVSTLLHAQFSVYLALAFFSVWFSLPTTIFWLIATVAIGVFVKIPPLTALRKGGK